MTSQLATLLNEMLPVVKDMDLMSRLEQGDLVGCCGIPNCEHDPDDSMENTVVLVNAESVQSGNYNQRLEAFVLCERETTVKIRLKNGTEGWYDESVIVDTLGPATDAQYEEFGVTKPEPPPRPNYQTGTYVAPTNDGFYLVEVDRIGDNYYIRMVGDSQIAPLLPEVYANLDNFSDPDGPGNYVLEPGPYYVAKMGRMIEVIPHGGYSYYRFINDGKLTRLAPNLAGDCARVESDTFEVNAVMFLPQDTPSVENGIPNLENDENAPTGCCQAAPREEPREA